MSNVRDNLNFHLNKLITFKMYLGVLMKRRSRITCSLRDNWIERWKLENKRSSHYVSFIKTQDLKSKGSKSRTPDFNEPGQDRDLLSTNERHFFYRLRFSNQFVWIKEQYPLLSIERAVAISKKLGVRYPTYPYTPSVQVVMTTDFYCQHINGEQVAYSIKDEQAHNKLTKIQKQNVENKQKIERVFWESKGVKWHLIMSDSIKTIFSQNLEQLYPHYSIGSVLTVFLPRWLGRIAHNIKESPKARVSEVLSWLAREFDIDYAESVSMFLHCIWHRKIWANLSEQLLRFECSAVDLGLRVNTDA